ncbi:3-oxoacyl-[acyl-carrier protein] reductase [Nocardia tenerifensis]|uniref:3-oxoacyl-[acyl-carrier protein] reductase n=1 Tax=Nocardia tenerifensis TaxID=228006 RepID=A0A318KF47_9NOCA|nr:SDR family oxidoreductase [Nocardia tenerifensis]PXX58177.1 3-oxoacyl-[acyl-carrier protein] reductase [Nocardia tenerifensis]
MARNIVVTGGATGIGKAIARVFAAEGDTVVITGRRAEPLHATAAELGVTAEVCDATDPAQIEKLVDRLPGQIDVLVNNAGGNTDFDSEAPTDLRALAAAWRTNLDANLLSAVLMTTALRDRLTGAVVHIGSIAADKGAGAYGAAKAGLASWNIQLSAELGPRGVTANVVAPGYISDTEFFRDKLTEERRASLIAATHTRRPGVPEDIAAAVHYLASPAARQVTGQVLAVNGGERTTR